MQYGLTEEQGLLRDTVRKLAKEKVEPGPGPGTRKGVQLGDGGTAPENASSASISGGARRAGAASCP